MQREVLNVQHFLAEVSTDQEYKSRFRALLRRKKSVQKVRTHSLRARMEHTHSISTHAH
jgi:hypothetical protein